MLTEAMLLQRTESLGSDGGFSVTSPRVFNTIGISSDGSIASSHDFAINARTSSSSIVNPLTLAVRSLFFPSPIEHLQSQLMYSF